MKLKLLDCSLWWVIYDSTSQGWMNGFANYLDIFCVFIMGDIHLEVRINHWKYSLDSYVLNIFSHRRLNSVGMYFGYKNKSLCRWTLALTHQIWVKTMGSKPNCNNPPLSKILFSNIGQLFFFYKENVLLKCIEIHLRMSFFKQKVDHSTPLKKIHLASVLTKFLGIFISEFYVLIKTITSLSSELCCDSRLSSHLFPFLCCYYHGVSLLIFRFFLQAHSREFIEFEIFWVLVTRRLRNDATVVQVFFSDMAK